MPALVAIDAASAASRVTAMVECVEPQTIEPGKMSISFASGKALFSPGKVVFDLFCLTE